jgi:hypothetical protein
VSDLHEAAQQAEIAFTHMGQAAETLAEALRSALAEAQRLETERNRLLVLLALLGRGQTPSSATTPRAGPKTSLAEEFEAWLVAEAGLKPSSAAVYRRWVHRVGARTRLAPERLAGLEFVDRHERIALHRWHAFLEYTGRNAA